MNQQTSLCWDNTIYMSRKQLILLLCKRIIAIIVTHVSQGPSRWHGLHFFATTTRCENKELYYDDEIRKEKENLIMWHEKWASIGRKSWIQVYIFIKPMWQHHHTNKESKIERRIEVKQPCGQHESWDHLMPRHHLCKVYHVAIIIQLKYACYVL